MTCVDSKAAAVCLMLSLALAATAQGQDQPGNYAGPKEDLHVYLLIGQSNMAGRAKVTDDIAGVIDRCYLLDKQGNWVPAKNPLNLFSTVRKGEGMQKLGPGYSFAVEMLKADPDINLGLVVNARGGSAIEQWLDNGKYYTALESRVKQAMRTGTLKGVLWHQGESNVSRHEKYLGQLKQLIATLREDLGESALPFVAGQINNTPEVEINKVIQQLPAAVTKTAVASSEGLKCSDRWHFTTESQLELGRRYAKQMLGLLSESAE